MAMFRDNSPGMRSLLDALQAPATPEELAGEERARALFTTFLPEPAPPRRRRLLPVSLAAAAVVAVSIGAVSVIAAFAPVDPSNLAPAPIVDQRDSGPVDVSTPTDTVAPTPGPVSASLPPADTADASAITSAPAVPRPRPLPTAGPAMVPPATSQPTPTTAATPTPTPTPTSTSTGGGNAHCSIYLRRGSAPPPLRRQAEEAGLDLDTYCASELGSST